MKMFFHEFEIIRYSKSFMILLLHKKQRVNMERHPFVNTNLIQTLEEEIKRLEQGKASISQAKSVVRIAQRLLSLKKLEIQEEEKILGELLRNIDRSKKKK